MKRITKILMTSLCVATLGISLVSAGGVLFGTAEDPTWTDVEFATEYVRDDTLTIPERQLTIGDNAYDASIKLVYPNGTTTMVESGSMSLDVAGQYTIIYEATADAQTYTEEVEIFVADKLWSVSNPKSSVEYGKVGDTDALLASLARNDELRFNKIIDVSNITMADTLVRAFINPAVAGSYEFDKLMFILTDAMDPTQTLTIRGNRSSSTSNQRFGSYWTSAAPNQTFGGWDHNYMGGAFSLTHPDGIRGMYVTNASFYSENGKFNPISSWPVTADKCAFKLSYDKDNVTTYINGSRIADHDNPAFYEDEPLWAGFPSGKVFLTVKAMEYAGEFANIAITNLYGYDLTAENKFVETDEPELTVDVNEKYVSYENDTYTFTPTAVVGGNYPVPTASAYDMYSGNLSVNTKVYFNYGSETNRVERPIKNGSFLVNKAGKYAIVYNVSDAMGNKAERVYWITAVSELENPLDISLDTSDVVVEDVCGQHIAVAPYTTTGGSGDVNVTITAKCGDVEIDATNGVFVPEQAGTWTITYAAKDYAGSEVEKSYNVEIAWGTIPVFVDEIKLPRYYISEMEYVVPTIIAYDYSSQKKVECVAKMVLKDANGEKTYNAGDTFVPVAEEGVSQLTLKFTAGGAEYETTVGVVTPIEKTATAQRVYIEKMFVGENFTATRDRKGLILVGGEAGSFAWIYSNPVVAENASLSVKGVKGSSNFDAMKVTLIDSENENIAVSMYVENPANGYAKVNFGDTKREMVKGFNFGTDTTGRALDEFVFAYKDGKFYVDAIGVIVDKDDMGNAFNGFPSGRVYISTEVVNAKAGASYIVQKFDNNLINNAVTDRTAPRISIGSNYGGIYAIGSQYVVAKALASDTLDASVSATVTVRTPEGKLVTDTNGLTLENVPADKEYVFDLVMYGQYLVEYISEDCNNRPGSMSFAINVLDRKAPKATIADTWSATAKVGETVVLPEITISDDSSTVDQMKVFRHVRNPHGDAITFGYDYNVNKETGKIVYNRYSFTFTQEGEYKFVNVIYDASGNQRVVEYVVMVTK